MAHFHKAGGVVEVLRKFDRREITGLDVVAWAEKALADSTDAESEPLLIELAWISKHRVEESQIESLLEQLSLKGDSLSISDAMLVEYGYLAGRLIEAQAPESIDANNCIPFVIGLFPEIVPCLESEWRSSSGHDPGLYIELSCFNEMTVEAIRVLDTALMRRCAACVETMLQLGDKVVTSAVRVGVLEGIGNHCANRSIDIRPFVILLGARSATAYVEIERYWASGKIDPSPEELERRRRHFEWYAEQTNSNSVHHPKRDGVRYRCPCCGCRTLDERGKFDICQVCYWEDDGQDDHDADIVRGGPNGLLSLTAARENYQRFGACEERMLEHVRPPRPEELE